MTFYDLLRSMPFYDLLWLNVYFQALVYCQDLFIKTKPEIIFTELQYCSLLTPNLVGIINKTWKCFKLYKYSIIS